MLYFLKVIYGIKVFDYLNTDSKYFNLILSGTLEAVLKAIKIFLT